MKIDISLFVVAEEVEDEEAAAALTARLIARLDSLGLDVGGEWEPSEAEDHDALALMQDG